MRSDRGFTLLELMITVAIVGIVAAMAVPIVTAARRNATVGSATWDLALRLKGLRARALGEQRDLVFVMVDAKDNDARGCSALAPGNCARWFLLEPQTAWQFSNFNPDSPYTNANFVDKDLLPRGIRMYLSAADRTCPAPFRSAKLLDSTLTRASCGTGNGRCLAFRYGSDGEVRAEPPGTTSVSPLGVGIALGSDLVDQHAGADIRGLLVAFPSGIVRSWGLER